VFIELIRIANFKSLKDVEVHPSGFVGLVGPNNAGKTNFTLAVGFLADVYRYGLGTGIARAGGIENIAFRRVRRSKSPVVFETEVSLDTGRAGKASALPPWAMRELGEAVTRFTVCHQFSVRASGAGVRAEYTVAEERLGIRADLRKPGHFDDASPQFGLTVMRDAEGDVRSETEGLPLPGPARKVFRGLRRLAGLHGGRRDRKWVVDQQQLLFAHPYPRDRVTWSFGEFMTHLGVFRFSQDEVRAPGTPTPSPTLSLPGGNLPALVEWLQRKYKPVWRRILNAMRDIVPGLEEIRTEVLPSKTLGLFLAEKGFGRAWRADEVSDGTMHVLAVLAATADPQVSALVLEEPETSLHPWVIREVGRALRELSKRKTVIVTTQSPVAIDLLHPSETWIVSRRNGQTGIRRLTEIDPRIEEDGRQGRVGLSEYLDAGLVPRAVPGGEDT